MMTAELAEIFLHNPQAMEIAEMLCRICHAWDDAVDGDVTHSPAQMDEAFQIALFGLPNNPLYQQHGHDIRLLMMMAYANWRASNVLSALPERRAVEAAHVIRHKLADVYIYLAMLAGGFAHAAAVAPRIWLWAHNETLDQFVAGGVA